MKRDEVADLQLRAKKDMSRPEWEGVLCWVICASFARREIDRERRRVRRAKAKRARKR